MMLEAHSLDNEANYENAQAFLTPAKAVQISLSRMRLLKESDNSCLD